MDRVELDSPGPALQNASMLNIFQWCLLRLVCTPLQQACHVAGVSMGAMQLSKTDKLVPSVIQAFICEQRLTC